MKRDYTNDEFEDFLKRSSDRLQLRPSDKVWQGISQNLNRRRRRFGWFAGFLLVTSLAGYFFSQNMDRLIKPATGLTQQNNPDTKSNSTRTNGKAIIAAEADEPLSAAAPQASRSLPQAATKETSRHRRSSLRIAYKKEALRFAPAEEPVAIALPPSFEEAAPLYTGTAIDNDPETSVTEAPVIDLQAAATDSLTVESITNLYQRVQKKNKFTFQFFFTPTVSYRKLSENKPYMTAVPQSVAAPNYAALYDINDAVTHKPNIGLEMGFSAKYPVAANIRLQGGLQFNMSRYDIKAFSNYTYQLATLAANSGGNINHATSYTNFTGTNSDWLQNLYFQLSAPVGIEVKFGNNRNTQFGIATTIQPTYMLGDRVYLISSDYKTYVEVPWLMRRWNVNTALETFVAYSTGKLDWQVGPQVRYQLLSSFEGKYPVKEHLFDFGLKVGVSLNKKSTASD